MKDEKEMLCVSTAGKMLLNEWSALRSVMGELARTRKAQQALLAEPKLEQTQRLVLMTDIELYDAFAGPFYPIIRQCVTVYTLITRFRTRVIITQDDSFKAHIQNMDLDLGDRANEEVNIAVLDKMQKKIDQMVRICYSEWKEQITKWHAMLVPLLEGGEIVFSSAEIEALEELETISELRDCFTDLQIKWPNTKITSYSFIDYFNLKLSLCVHSAAHRQHLTNSETLLQQYLKKIKSISKQINQEEKTWMTAQKNAIADLGAMNST